MVGVSVAWKYGEDKAEVDEMNETITKAVKKDQQERLAIVGSARQTETVDPTENFGPIRKQMYKYEKALLGPDEDEEELTDKQLEQKLKNMVTSDTAFVVFNTVAAANSAFDKAKDAGVKFGDET